MNEEEDMQSDYNKLQDARAALAERREHIKLLESANKMKNTRVKDLRWKIDEKQKVIEAQQRDIDLLHTRDDKGMNREKVLAAQLLEGAVIISQAVQKEEKDQTTISILQDANKSLISLRAEERERWSKEQKETCRLATLTEEMGRRIATLKEDKNQLQDKLNESRSKVQSLMQKEDLRALRSDSKVPANAFAALEECWDIVDSIVIQFKKG